MRTQQREFRGAVVEGRSRPVDRRVADGAVLRKHRRDVVWNSSAQGLGTVPLGQMTVNAGRRREVVVVTYVTRNAGRGNRRNVQAGQGKSGRAVVKRSSPAERGVARGALSNRERIRVGRVGRGVSLVVGGQVALRVSTIGRRDLQRIVIVDVAEIAGHVRMPVGQREAKGGVVKRSRRPGRNRVAGGAGRSRDREIRGDVIGNRSAHCLRTDKSCLVAAVAIG